MDGDDAMMSACSASSSAGAAVNIPLLGPPPVVLRRSLDASSDGTSERRAHVSRRRLRSPPADAAVGVEPVADPVKPGNRASRQRSPSLLERCRSSRALRRRGSRQRVDPADERSAMNGIVAVEGRRCPSWTTSDTDRPTFAGREQMPPRAQTQQSSRGCWISIEAKAAERGVAVAGAGRSMSLQRCRRGWFRRPRRKRRGRAVRAPPVEARKADRARLAP
jgi:hypothetical protein